MFPLACMAAPPPPTQGPVGLFTLAGGRAPAALGALGGCKLTLPVGKSREHPRPLAADRRDRSWDAHGQGWAEMGARSFGRGAEKFTAQICKPGLGEGPGVPCVQPPLLEPLRPPLRASPPVRRRAPSRVRRALPSRAAGARPERSGSAYLRALGPAAKAGGKLPQPAGEHRCSRRCGPACVYARVRECVRLCMRPAGWRAGSAKRLLLSPAGDAAVTRSCGRLTGGCWPRRSQNHLDRSARPSASKRQQHAPQAPAGAGAGAEPEPLAVVLNGQLRAPQPRLRRRPTPEMPPPLQLLCSPLAPHAPLRPWHNAGPNLSQTLTHPLVTAFIATLPPTREQAGDCLR